MPTSNNVFQSVVVSSRIKRCCFSTHLAAAQDTPLDDNASSSELIKDSTQGDTSDSTQKGLDGMGVYKFKYLLNKWYYEVHNEKLNDAFIPENYLVSSKHSFWTATFSCPLTGDRIQAGKLPSESRTRRNVDGRWYYKSKRLALQAVSMEVLDHYGLLLWEKGVPREQQTTGVSFLPYDSTTSEIQAYYMEHHHTSIQKSMFSARSKSSFGSSTSVTWWTTSFTCPVTGEVIHAKELPNHDDESFHSDSEGCWYRNKSDALRAVETHILEVKKIDKWEDYSVTVDRKARKRLANWYQKHYNVDISDDNYVTSAMNLEGDQGGNRWTASFICPVSADRFDSGTLTQLIDDVYNDPDGVKWYKRKDEAMAAAAIRAYNALRLEEIGEKQSDSKDYSVTESPNLARNRLTNWYQKNHSVGISDDNYVTSAMSLKGGQGGNRWTASFICPVSADRFGSGTLTQLMDDVYNDSDGVKWYKRKDEAIAAAALRAYDAFRFKETGEKQPRYCEEFPITNVQLVPENSSHDREQSESIEPFADAVDDSASDIDKESGDDEDEDEEDYVIALVPQRIGSREEQGFKTAATTFDLIAEAWVETNNFKKKSNKLLPGFLTPKEERQQTIDRAFAWVARQKEQQTGIQSDRIQFDTHGQTSNRTISNLILATLASTCQRMPVDDGDSCRIEDTAHAVLEQMWSTPSSSPDAKSYAEYFKCLQGDRVDVARRAKSIFEAMTSGSHFGGRILPKPNITVYNSFVQCLAEAGIQTPPHEIGGTMKPDRESFLSSLSSNAYSMGQGAPGGGFDTDHALDCIQQMQKLSEEYNDPSLKPDIQVYNAPLRLSAGLLSVSSRPYSRCIPWDVYIDIYQDGFTKMDKEDLLVKEATACENWLESMKTGNTTPNIESYESVIQAWIRTGTLEGLQKAENMVNTVLQEPNDDVQPRLQTYHPILSAWAYSGSIDGPERVEHWIKRLEESIPNFPLDGRFRLAPFIAHVSCQRNALKNSTGPESLESKSNSEMVRKRAIASSQHLEHVINDFKDGADFFLETQCFMMTAQAWKNAGLIEFHAENPDPEQINSCLHHIKETVDAFDRLVAFLCTSDNKYGPEQLLHCIQRSPKIYSTALSAISDFDQAERGRSPDQLQESHLLREVDWIGEKIRRSEEFRIFFEENFSETRDEVLGRPRYEDLFDYPYEPLLDHRLSDSWIDFYSSIILALEDSDLCHQRKSDIIRTCVLITDISKLQNTADSFNESRQIYKRIIRLLEQPGMKSLGHDSLIKHLIHDIEGVHLRQLSGFKSNFIESSNQVTKSSEREPGSGGGEDEYERVRKVEIHA